MKKALTICMCAVLAIVGLYSPAHAEEEGFRPDFEVTAKAVYMYNLDTDSLIYEKDANVPLSPASITKIMTCILALENTADLDSEMVVYPENIQNWLYDYQYTQKNGVVSSGGLMAGNTLTMREALYAIMLPSANEVAMSIAEHIAGSQEAFAEMMNAKAKEIGAKNTNFVNANGLYDPAHVSTAYDIAQIAMYARELPGFMDIASTTAYEVPASDTHNGFHWGTTNHMMVQDSSYYYPALTGIKTGTLPDAGRCFVSTATKDGFTYMLVVLGCPLEDDDGTMLSENMAFVQTKKFYDWAFDTFRVKTLVDQGQRLTEVPLRLSLEHDNIKLKAEARFTALIPKDIEASSVTKVFDLPDYVNAPIKQNDYVGDVTLILSGEEIGTVRLLAADNIEASSALLVLETLRGLVGSFYFKFAVVFLSMLILLYAVLMVLRNRRRNKSGYRPRRRL